MKKVIDYQSDVTHFLKDFLENNPQVVEKQKRHRATWWDRPQNAAERARLDEATVKQQGYVYYHYP